MFIALLHHDVDVLAVHFILHTEIQWSCLNWLDEDSFLPGKNICSANIFFVVSLYKCEQVN